MFIRNSSIFSAVRSNSEGFKFPIAMSNLPICLCYRWHKQIKHYNIRHNKLIKFRSKNLWDEWEKFSRYRVDMVTTCSPSTWIFMPLCKCEAQQCKHQQSASFKWIPNAVSNSKKVCRSSNVGWNFTLIKVKNLLKRMEYDRDASKIFHRSVSNWSLYYISSYRAPRISFV